MPAYIYHLIDFIFTLTCIMALDSLVTVLEDQIWCLFGSSSTALMLFFCYMRHLFVFDIHLIKMLIIVFSSDKGCKYTTSAFTLLKHSVQLCYKLCFVFINI